jgi:hypothetical protein
MTMTPAPAKPSAKPSNRYSALIIWITFPCYVCSAEHGLFPVAFTAMHHALPMTYRAQADLGHSCYRYASNVMR